MDGVGVGRSPAGGGLRLLAFVDMAGASVTQARERAYGLPWGWGATEHANQKEPRTSPGLLRHARTLMGN